MPVAKGRTAPLYLRPATRDWWSEVVETWQLAEPHVKVLTAAAEAWDRRHQARQIIARKGLVFADRFGQPRSRPEVAIERDSALRFARLVHQLGLEFQPTDRYLGLEQDLTHAANKEMTRR